MIRCRVWMMLLPGESSTLSEPASKAQQALSQLAQTGRSFIGGLRLRAFIWVLGIALCTFAAVTFGAISWIPAVGVAVAAAAMSLNKLAARLSRPTCMGCGHDLSGQVLATWGRVCPECGALEMPRPKGLPAGSGETAPEGPDVVEDRREA